MRPAGAPAGARRALWGIFDSELRLLLGRARPRVRSTPRSYLAASTAIVTSDRWWAYAHLPLARRQLCWAHLQARLAAHAEGLAAEQEFGEVGLELCERVFWAWEIFGHTFDRRELKRTIRRLQRTYKPIIRSYAARRARNKRCRGMARNLLKAWPALWTFASHAGVEPTNNHAERALRSAVIYRKLFTRQPVRGGRAADRAGCSPRTPPAAYSAAQCSPTSPTRSQPTPAVTPCPCSAKSNRLNGYGFIRQAV